MNTTSPKIDLTLYLILTLKIFFVFGPGFAFILEFARFAGSFFNQQTYEFNLLFFGLQALCFGLIMAFIGIRNIRKDAKKRGFNDITKEVISLTHFGSFKTSLSFPDIIQKFEKASVVKKMTAEGNHIKILTKNSAKSVWGEIVNISIEPTSEKENKIEILSKSVSPITIYDFGINQGNINAIRKLLSA